jgi:hypothetical protein
MPYKSYKKKVVKNAKFAHDGHVSSENTIEEYVNLAKISIEYLSLIISHNQVAMDPAKVAGVVEWPVSKNLKETQFS